MGDPRDGFTFTESGESRTYSASTADKKQIDLDNVMSIKVNKELYTKIALLASLYETSIELIVDDMLVQAMHRLIKDGYYGL